MVALLAIGIFYYTLQFTPLRTDTDKIMVKTERVGEIKEKRDQMSSDESVISKLGHEKKAETTLSAALSSRKEREEDKSLPARAPAGIPPSLKERLVAQSRPFATVSGEISPKQPKALTRMARTLTEDKAGSKEALYAFELGNFYFSQSDLEKAIATYSMALMMNPQEGYADTIRFQLAISYKKLNDCKSAVKVLDEIQKRHPEHTDIDKVILMAGDCYMDLHAYDKAEIYYTNFINKYPDRKLQVADKLEIARKFRRVNLSY
jgi:tetratricopeptide (TPR) repeat protein